MPSYDLAALRAQEFPWADSRESLYLNNASTGPLPARSIAAVERALQLRALPSRFPDDLIWSTLAEARVLAARMINSAPGEVAISTNTSFGINLAAFGLPLGPGDVVIGPDREFPANVYPWMAAAERRGFEYRQVPCRADGGVDEDALVEAVHDPAVKAVALSWVSFTTGYTVDLATVGRACRATGTYFVVDAIQGVGAALLDVIACEVDILACGAQKWLLSPWGTGFTYVRSSLLAEVAPHVVGWTAVQGSDDFSTLLNYDLTWRTDARRFEALTLPIHDVIGMNASLELLQELDVAEVERHVRQLIDIVVEWAAERPHVEMATPVQPERRLGIVSLRLPDAAAASARLKAGGVAHSVREGLIRFSPHCYNTDDEVREALRLLEA